MTTIEKKHDFFKLDDEGKREVLDWMANRPEFTEEASEPAISSWMATELLALLAAGMEGPGEDEKIILRRLNGVNPYPSLFETEAALSRLVLAKEGK